MISSLASNISLDQPSTSEKNETHLEVEAPSISVKVSKSPTAADDDKTNKDSTPMEKYVHMRPELYRNTEHDVFKLAKKDLVKENDSKLAKVCTNSVLNFHR